MTAAPIAAACHFSQLGRIALCGKETRSRATGKPLTFTDVLALVTCEACRARHAAREALKET